MSPLITQPFESCGAHRCDISAFLAVSPFALVLADARSLALPTCTGSFGAGARRCSIPCIPCIGSLCAGARRCQIPCIPCMSSFGAGARRCPIPCTPCIRSFGAGARTCSIPCIPCIGSLCAGARRCQIPCIPCIGSFGAGLGFRRPYPTSALAAGLPMGRSGPRTCREATHPSWAFLTTVTTRQEMGVPGP
jgi:hypothetical protein